MTKSGCLLRAGGDLKSESGCCCTTVLLSRNNRSQEADDGDLAVRFSRELDLTMFYLRDPTLFGGKGLARLIPWSCGCNMRQWTKGKLKQGKVIVHLPPLEGILLSIKSLEHKEERFKGVSQAKSHAKTLARGNTHYISNHQYGTHTLTPLLQKILTETQS